MKKRYWLSAIATVVLAVSLTLAVWAQNEKDVIEKKELLSSSQIKLSSVQNSKEYESVLRELDVLKKSIAEGEAKLKEMSNLNSKYESEHTSAKEITEGIKKQLEELTNSKKDEDQELHDELESLQIKREEVATPIKKSFLAKYDRVRVHRNNLGIVSVNDEVCNGCYMRIPPQLFVDVKKNKSIHQNIRRNSTDIIVYKTFSFFLFFFFWLFFLVCFLS